MGGFDEAFAPIEHANRVAVITATWGHLAPKRGSEYRIHGFVAADVYNESNPVFIKLDQGRSLSDSPWLYNALHALLPFLWNDKSHSGTVREFEGTMKNYKFVGKVRTAFDLNKNALPTPWTLITYNHGKDA